MFTLGGTELLLLGVLVLLLFGPDKVPQFARTLGRAMREFNKYKDIMESAFRVEMEAAEAAATAKDAAGEGETDGLDKIKQAAEASREFAAEHDVALEDASDLGIGAKAQESGDEASEMPETEGIAARVTDEDEEEG